MHGLLGVAAPDLECEGLVGLHRLDDVAELGFAGDGLSVGGDDDVSAEAVGLAGERDGGGAGAEPGERGAASGGDALDDEPVVAGEREGAGEALA